jgi:hypothetical protein
VIRNLKQTAKAALISNYYAVLPFSSAMLLALPKMQFKAHQDRVQDLFLG